jgi:hypothetical protein
LPANSGRTELLDPLKLRLNWPCPLAEMSRSIFDPCFPIVQGQDQGEVASVTPDLPE